MSRARPVIPDPAPAAPASRRQGPAWSRIALPSWAGGEAAWFLAASAALVIGVWSRRSDALEGFSIGGVLDGIASQLPATVPAAVLVTGAMAVNVVAGAYLVRLLRDAPFETWSDAILGGYAGAVLLGLVLLCTLGGAGLFRQAVIAVVLVAALLAAPLAGARAGPLCKRPVSIGRPQRARWLLVALVWAGPILLVLASPVPPFADVLPNHVAPAEHLRVFGGIDSLATYPSPVYGPSRLFLGYTAVMGTLAAVTGLPAALAVAASTAWLVVVSAAGARRLAAAAFGARAGSWALLVFPLTFTFVRMPDVRDSVTALPLAALALAQVVGRHVPQGGEAGSRVPSARRRPDWLLATAVVGAAYVHPLVGTLTALALVLVTLGDPARHVRRTVPALVAAAVALLPQLAIMVGLAPTPAWGVAALIAAAIVAIAGAALLDRIPWNRVSRRWATRSLLGAAALALGGVALARPSAIGQAIGWFNPAFPALFVAAGLAAIGLAPASRGGRRLLVAAVAAGGVALLVVALVAGPSLLGDSLRYEVPKAVGYWLPWACVPAAAGLLATLQRWRPLRSAGLRRRLRGSLPGLAGAIGAERVPRAVGSAVVIGFVAIVLLPIGSPAANSVQASHAVADVLAYDLRTAATGYWQGYPDPRQVVGEAGRQVLDVLDAEIAAGRLGANDQVLHVAASYEEWASVPIGVFAGVDETMVCEDSAVTIFTAGGRIHPLADLDALLRQGYAYVVLEPAGLPASTRAAIVAAGFRPVFTGAAAEVFLAPGRAGP